MLTVATVCGYHCCLVDCGERCTLAFLWKRYHRSLIIFNRFNWSEMIKSVITYTIILFPRTHAIALARSSSLSLSLAQHQFAAFITVIVAIVWQCVNHECVAVLIEFDVIRTGHTYCKPRRRDRPYSVGSSLFHSFNLSARNCGHSNWMKIYRNNCLLLNEWNQFIVQTSKSINSISILIHSLK